MTRPFGDAAVVYLNAGWNPLPLPPRQKQSPPTGYTGWNAASVTKADVNDWILSQPDGNIAMRLPRGVIGIDIDHYGNKNGLDSLKALEDLHGRLPPTYTSTARDGGSGQRFFCVPIGLRLPNSLGDGIDTIQAHHRYAVVAPSLHPDGMVYRWYDHTGAESDRPPELDELAYLPWTWITALGTDRAGNPVATATRETVEAFIAAHHIGRRDDKLRGLQTILAEKKGGRHDRLISAACLAMREAAAGHYPAGTAINVLRSWWDKAMGDAKRRQGNEFDDAIAWAVAQIQADQEGSEHTVLVEGPGPSLENVADGPSGSELPSTDVDIADAFMDHYHQRARYVPRWQRWLVFVDGRWVEDHDNVRVTQLLVEHVRTQAAGLEAIALLDDPPAYGRARRALGYCKSSKGLKQVLHVARLDPRVVTDHEALEAKPDLLNVTNGTINLNTFELQPHDPRDLLIHQARVIYDPAGQAPLFTAFVERILPDQDVRRYVQNLLGMALLGKGKDHVFPIATGNGANGKSTLTNVVCRVMGPYAVTMSRDLIAAHKQDSHPTTKASLFRRRFAHSGEINEGVRLDEALVKELTGGDRIQARRMREDEWEFDPTHTLWLHANHKPRITGTDNGIWRRVSVIPFDVSIPADEQDPNLADQIFIEESSGVLNWLLQGLAIYNRNGLKKPAAVEIATGGYRGDSDTVSQFLSDAGLHFHSEERISTPLLKQLHESWYTDAAVIGTVDGHYILLAKRLKAQGCVQNKVGGIRGWKGIGLA
jgi:putative DNA primase/helicase